MAASAKRRSQQPADYHLTVTGINDSSVKAAAQSLLQTRQALQQARDSLQQARLIAPFDGIVLEVLAKTGDTVPTGK